MRFSVRAVWFTAPALFAAALLLSVSGGGSTSPLTPPPAEASVFQTGLATWYGPGFEGNRTACGQIYSSAEYTAASNTLPCGSVIAVTNLDTGAVVTVTVTDRGGFRPPNILDLSYAAFGAIAHPDQGRIPVSVAFAE